MAIAVQRGQMMRWLAGALIVALALLQYRLWRGDGSFAQKAALEHNVREQRRENATLQQRNQKIAAEVADLKSGLDSIEERARNDLGMVKDGETFYMIIDRDKPGATP